MTLFEKLLRALLSKVYKKTDTEIEAILSNTDETAAENSLLELDRTRISELQKPKPGSTFQDGYKKAKGEVLKQLETDLKEKYSIESDAEGVELVEAILASKATEGVKAEEIKKLTAEDIRKLPAFQTIQREHTAAVKKIQTDADKKVADNEAAQARKDTIGTLKGSSSGILDGLNPVLPKDQKVAARQRNAFLDSVLNSYEWQNQDGQYLPMKDGKVATDSHGNALTLEDIIKTSAGEWFEFAANNGGANAGNAKPGEAGGTGGSGGQVKYPANVTKPKTFDDYSKIVQDDKIPLADRKIVQQVWEQEQTAGTK